MTERKRATAKAYQNPGFLNSKDARPLRILSEYFEPKSRFDHFKVEDTIVSIPVEEFDNPYVTRELAFHFHYFFMRKFWFAYLAKAVIVFPGGYGTLDELFELLTLVQTRKMRKPMPIVLFGTEYWREIVNFDALARHGMIDPEDVELVHRTDSVDEAFDWIVLQLAEKALGQPGATM